jgi:GLPGLI family protein
MKNKSFYLIINTAFFLLTACFVHAQGNSGTIKYTITHDMNKKMEANEFISKAQKEQSAYIWGSDNIYNEHAAFQFNHDSYMYKIIEKEDDGPGYSRKSREYIIYRNIKENTTYDVIRMLDKIYVIEDSIQYPKWKIKNDMKEIAGHICMNAYYRDTIKGKDVTAWFALDMPLHYGPDRYGGLPGMILEINMNNGAVVITATEVSFSEEEIKIEKPVYNKKQKNISEEEFTEIIYKFVQQCKKNKRAYYYSISY